MHKNTTWRINNKNIWNKNIPSYPKSAGEHSEACVLEKGIIHDEVGTVKPE